MEKKKQYMPLPLYHNLHIVTIKPVEAALKGEERWLRSICRVHVLWTAMSRGLIPKRFEDQTAVAPCGCALLWDPAHVKLMSGRH